MTNPPNRIVEDARRRASQAATIQRYNLVEGQAPCEERWANMLPSSDGQYVRYADIKHLLPRTRAAQLADAEELNHQQAMLSAHGWHGQD